MNKTSKLIFVVALVAVGVVIVVWATGRKQNGQQTTQTMTQPTQQAQTGPDTVVPAEMKLEEYLEKYYKAYKEQRWEEAYAMLPASRKSTESFDQYVATLSGMPLESYTVKTAKISGSTAAVAVDVSVGSSGGTGGNLLQINWSFTKKDGKWVAEATKTMMR